MKKLIYLIVLALILGLVLTGCELLSNVGQVPVTSQTKVKPTGNLAGAEEVAWNLSGAVMPVSPYGPYGTMDISGSDTASKLIVNQPNGAVEVTITGAMNGLNPNTDYTVYLSKSYEAYVFTGWNVKGVWVLRLYYGTSNYDHDLIIDVQSNGDLAGTGGYPAGQEPPYNYPYNETVVGNVNINTGEITFHSDYENTYYYDAEGTIALDGTMSGNWTGKGQSTYTWESISGKATNHTGDTGWSGLFTATIPPFTFTTDDCGSGSWHVNLKDSDFPPGTGTETYTLSVWINEEGKTMLISENFDVEVSY